MGSTISVFAALPGEPLARRGVADETLGPHPAPYLARTVAWTGQYGAVGKRQSAALQPRRQHRLLVHLVQLVSEVAQGARALRAEPVAGRDHHRHPLAEERPDLQLPAAGGRRADDAEIQAALEDSPDDLARGALAEGEAHPGVGLEEASQPVRQPVRPDRVQEADPDLAALRRRGAGRLGHRVAKLLEQALGPGEETGAGGRQADAAPDPVEERHPHLGLQPGDLAGDRRLVDLEGLGGAAQVLVAGGHLEGPEGIDIDAVHASIPYEIRC